MSLGDCCWDSADAHYKCETENVVLNTGFQLISVTVSKEMKGIFPEYFMER